MGHGGTGRDGRVVATAAELCSGLVERSLSVSALCGTQHQRGVRGAEGRRELPRVELSGDADTVVEQNRRDDRLPGVVGTNDYLAQCFERERLFAAMGTEWCEFPERLQRVGVVGGSDGAA